MKRSVSISISMIHIRQMQCDMNSFPMDAKNGRGHRQRPPPPLGVVRPVSAPPFRPPTPTHHDLCVEEPLSAERPRPDARHLAVLRLDLLSGYGLRLLTQPRRLLAGGRGALGLQYQIVLQAQRGEEGCQRAAGWFSVCQRK